MSSSSRSTRANISRSDPAVRLRWRRPQRLRRRGPRQEAARPPGLLRAAPPPRRLAPVAAPPPLRRLRAPRHPYLRAAHHAFLYRLRAADHALVGFLASSREGAARCGSGHVNAKENIMVTVRFRPSVLEINKGTRWLGMLMVTTWCVMSTTRVLPMLLVHGKHSLHMLVCYPHQEIYQMPHSFQTADKVFGPATTTRRVYDVAAQHVVSGAMEGINGTVFAYGVTSSGKTHTMHGEQKSPGIIPLAVKDVFSIIQDTPGREFLLRVSYLEIYNEVINDLLDPTGQNLRIEKGALGTYVEGIKEEVVLSPHRHVGSNNFNLVSGRPYYLHIGIHSSLRPLFLSLSLSLTSTSFGDTLSPSGETEEEEVRLCQLNLIDLAGSESSKTETTGLRRKEGSYINKSLLTLGTVIIAKLTDGKATHIPYRDSKLTRLLQYSLSGHGRISLICTVTPASSNTEETHNTLKFAHRSKHVELKASQNKIIVKSLIKKYQKEITCLKEELQQLRRGMMGNGYILPTDQEDLVNLKLQLEAGQVKLQSRLEQEEEAKAALMGRIQRLTKLILVSTKSSISSKVSGHASLHDAIHLGKASLLIYLIVAEYSIEDDDVSLDSSFRLKQNLILTILADSDSTASGSPSFSRSSQQKHLLLDLKDGRRKSVTRKADDSALGDSFLERTQAGDLFSAAPIVRHPLPVNAGWEVAFLSSLKRLLEQAANSPDDSQIQDQIERLKNEISEKKSHIHVLEQRIMQSLESTDDPAIRTEMTQTFSRLSTQLSEMTCELEIMSADNKILQDQLQTKVSENAELQETVAQLKRQISNLLKASKSESNVAGTEFSEPSTSRSYPRDQADELSSHENVPCRTVEENKESPLKSQVLMQAAEIENLKQDKLRLAEEKDGLEIHSQKLAEESYYAKELAAAAAVELKNLAEEVTRLSYENSKLVADFTAAKELTASVTRGNETKRRDQDNGILVEEMQKELVASCQREAALEDTLSQKARRENELLKIIDDAKCHEHDLENELENMWALVSKIKKESSQDDLFEFKSKQNGFHSSKTGTGRIPSDMEVSDNWKWDGISTLEEAKAAYNFERKALQRVGKQCLD
ncbi:hypothetical protein ZWY2020_025890 [Hordeum vulgare]|nr:hypothetical protein ZWY2020_025890 [Hordeum vulgare]